MSNEITERTVKKNGYVIEVQNSRLNFILRFAISCRREDSVRQHCSFKDRATANLSTNKLRQFESFHEARMPPAI